MITLFEKFVNKSKYGVFVIYIDNTEEGYKIQQLCFDNGISWASGSMKNYDMNDYNYIYIVMDEGRIYRSMELDKDFIQNYNWDRKIYSIKEYNDIESILQYGLVKPNYKPKKFNKTLESVNNIPWIEATFLINNEKESLLVQKKLLEKGYEFWNHDKEIKNLTNYPIYIFVDFIKNSISYSTLDGLLVKSFQEYVEEFNTIVKPNALNPVVFNAKEIIYLDTIKKIGIIKPSYNPKKFNRLIEDTKYWPYRVKTEEEMINDYGIDWRDNINYHFDYVGWSESMDYLLGKSIEQEFDINDLIHGNTISIYDDNERRHWGITYDMLTKNIIIPNYKPKKFNRTYESMNDFNENIKEIIVEVNNNDEIDLLKKTLGDKVRFSINTDYNLYFPNWYFITFRDFIKRANIWDVRSVKQEMLDSIEEDEETYKKILTINDMKKIIEIVNTGKLTIAPSYKPKKFDRKI